MRPNDDHRSCGAETTQTTGVEAPPWRHWIDRRICCRCILGHQSCRPRHCRWYRGTSLVAEIHILQRLLDLERAQKRDGVLQIVALFAGDPQFVALDRGLDLELAFLEGGYEALAELAIDALLDDHDLANLVAGGPLGILEVQS